MPISKKCIIIPEHEKTSSAGNKFTVSEHVRCFEKKLTDAEKAKLEDVRKALTESLTEGGTDSIEAFTAAIRAEEPANTEVLRSLESEFSKLDGLEYRLKSESSTNRKVKKELLDNFWTQEELLEFNLNDINRYTYVVDEVKYWSEVDRISEALTKAGYKNFKFKDYWSGDQYKGLNTNFFTPDGGKLELQFHTPASIGVKPASHEIYERIRKIGTSKEEKAKLQKEIIALWADVTPPTR